ncbi:MAG TPA: hypothetical protein VK903_00430, partial [Propionicimonas sp.]|nr:hypothetical protein [Propionicimonas sp.]
WPTGWGGHRAGDTASAIVVDEFGGPPDAAVVTSDWIVDAFTRADGRIREGWGGGTTVAGVGSVHAGCSSGWRAGVGGRWHGQVQPGVREVLV